MKQISIPAMLRIRVPDDTSQDIINDIVQAIQSDTIPSIEDSTEVMMAVQEQVQEYALETSTSDTIQSVTSGDVDIWVDGQSVNVDDVG